MRLYDWFYRQRVTEGEMDAAFGAAQTALMTLRATQAKGVWLGDWFGEPPLAAPEVPGPNAPEDMTIDVPGPLRAWDVDGNFLYDPSLVINIDCSEDYQGTPTAVLLNVNEKYIAVCAAFDWVLSDPRVDGNGDTVYYQRDPGVVYEVYQGAEALIGFAVKPSVPTDRVVLCDVLLHWNDLTIAAGDIEFDRTQLLRLGYDSAITLKDNGVFTNFPTTGFSDATGPSVSDALAEIDDWMTGHLDGTGDHHDADDIDFDNAASGLAATEVQGALDEIDGVVDGLVAGAAMWDTDVRFSGLMVDPSTNQAPVAGDIQLWKTAGQLYVRGDDGAGAGTFSTLAFSPAADGGLLLTQADNAANVGSFFSVQGNSDAYAGLVYNLFDDGGDPSALSCYVGTPSDLSVALLASTAKGTAVNAFFGGLNADNPFGVKVVNRGADSASSSWGVSVADESPFAEDPDKGYAFHALTRSAQYATASYGAWLENNDAGANGYEALHLLPKDGTGIYANVVGGQFFDVVGGTGNLGTLRAGTAGIGGLAIEVDDSTTYGLSMYASDSADTFTALVRLAQNGNGLLLSGEMDPAQDSIVLTSRVAAGDSTKAGIKVDHSAATSNDPVPFWGKTRTDAGYAFYAEKGLFAAKSTMDADVFTLGTQDDVASWSGMQWQAKLAGAWTGLACDYVQLDRDLEVPLNVTQRNHVSKRRIATAWAQCAAAGGITGGHFNVLSVTNTAVGTYSIVLDIDAGAAMTGRAVVVTCSDRGTEKDAIMACVTDPLTNPIVVKLRKINDTAGAVDISYVDEDFSFVVFQDQ